jgi:trk system potassium uptake protein TrkH
VIVGTAAVSYSMDMDTMTALFEIMSAGGTVGISLGVTPSLNIFSKIIVMLMMYFGRVGILTVTYAVMFNLSKKNVSGVSHPEANMLVG